MKITFVHVQKINLLKHILKEIILFLIIFLLKMLIKIGLIKLFFVKMEILFLVLMIIQ